MHMLETPLMPIRSLMATCLLATIVLLTAAKTSETAEPLKKGDRIVFLGDSITQAGAGPNGYVTLVRKALDEKLPDLGIEVIGAGISGNRVPNLEARLDRDVIEKKPTIFVIYIGINDVWHSLNDRGTPREEFEAGLKRIIAKINDAGARVVLCTPSMIGEKIDGSNQLDVMLEHYSATSRKVAVDTNSQLYDLRRRFLTHLRDHNPKNAEKNVLTSDGVHLNAAGNEFVRDCMLEALGVYASEQRQLLRHVVLFKFKAEITEAQINEVVDAFAHLPGRIDTIVDFDWGTDVSVENKAAGFTHGFVVSFRDAAGRDTYLPHPAHQEFVSIVKDRLEDVLVFDFVTGR
jgi:lysophospholipase L1-like esterase